MVSDSRDRGQLILIGAIALAFIILGIVVVFNGVLYTETLSSGSTSQSATSANVTELEIEQGIACLLAEADDEAEAKNGIDAFSDAYRDSTAHSTPTVVEITPDEVSDDSADVTITYDSTDLSYEQGREIEASDCNS